MTAETLAALASATDRASLDAAFRTRAGTTGLASICIVTANRRAAALEAVASALAQREVPCEVIVVDNASADGTAEAIVGRFPAVRVVRAPRDLGCPGGRNLAMLEARGEWLVHLDDDGVLAADAVARAVSCAEAYPDAGAVMFRIEEFGRVRLVAPAGSLLPAFSGGAVLLRRDALRAAGLYPGEFVRQGEEDDLLLRLADRGWVVRYCPEACMDHRPLHRQGGARNATVRQIERHRVLNSLRTALRHRPAGQAALTTARLLTGLAVRSLRTGRPGDALRVARTFCAEVPRLLGERRPCHRGAHVLAVIARDAMKASWPVDVPIEPAAPMIFPALCTPAPSAGPAQRVPDCVTSPDC
jgi:GT2 family glycosyltransferase